MKQLFKKTNIVTKFRPQIKSRHPSHSPLRQLLSLLPFRSVIRFGSTTEVDDSKNRIELNSTESIKNSSNKLLMKECFENSNVKTADWFNNINNNFYQSNVNDDDPVNIENLPYPIVAKHHYGSKGSGNTLIHNQEQLEQWIKGKTLSNYIFEKFYNYGHEFRLHISKNGCFYTCRKALKANVAQEEKWHFHDDTCVWFMEDNDKFFKPNSWNDIISDCVKALEAIGADVLAFDVKVQSPINNKGKIREYQDYILLECNSAPSFGDITIQKYLEEIPKLLKAKFVENA